MDIENKSENKFWINVSIDIEMISIREMRHNNRA